MPHIHLLPADCSAAVALIDATAGDPLNILLDPSSQP